MQCNALQLKGSTRTVNTILQVKSQKRSNTESGRFHFKPEVDALRDKKIAIFETEN